MRYPQLLKLSNEYDADFINNADRYFARLTPSAAQNITASRLAASLGIDYSLGAEFIKRCVDIGFLHRHSVFRCTECGLLIRRLQDISELPREPIQCHHCGTELNIQDDGAGVDIDAVFSIKNKDARANRQHVYIVGKQIKEMPVISQERLKEYKQIVERYYAPFEESNA